MLICIIDEDKRPEFGFGSLAFPDNEQLLSDPNIWIGNTGATTHSMPYESGLFELSHCWQKEHSQIFQFLQYKERNGGTNMQKN